MKFNKLVILSISFSALFTSCDDEETIQAPSDYTNGVLVTGEGSAAGTGSVSYIPNEFSESKQLIYKKENDTELGTFLQSLVFDENRAFICVDESNTITVVNRQTFGEIDRVQDGLIRPRYMTIVDGVGYATNWGSKVSETDDFIAIIDLENYTVTETIAVGNVPERIVSKNGKLYVSHKQGTVHNNIISVIDIQSKSKVEINVKDKPDELFFDDNDNLIVLSEGVTNWNSDYSEVLGHTLAAISKIDIETNEILEEYVFEEGSHTSLMTVSDGNIYYVLDNKVYEMEVSDAELPSTPIFETTGYTYGLAVRNNQLFSIDANFNGLSELSVYDLVSKSKTNTLKVGIGASKIYFNE